VEFVADTDPRFVALHPELRAVLREAEQFLETNMRAALEAAFAQVPPIILDAVKPSFETFAAGLPATFIRGQYQIYKMLHDQRELSEYLTRDRQNRSGPPSKRTH